MSSEVQLADAAVGVDDHNPSRNCGVTANGTDVTGPLPSPVPAPADPSRPGADPLGEPLLDRDSDLEQGLAEDDVNDALQEIDNVLWIKDLEINFKNRCQEALSSWAEKDKLFTSRIDRKRKQSSEFQNEVYQLVGYYSVFQGVLLTAVAQSNLLHCNNTWTACLLSSLASFVTVIGVILKLRSIKGLKDTIAGEEATRRILVTWQLSLREEGEKFNFDSVRTRRQQEESSRDTRSARRLIVSFVAVVVALILFSVAFVVSIRQILCNPGPGL